MKITLPKRRMSLPRFSTFRLRNIFHPVFIPTGQNKGFGLIELMIAIAILGVIVASLAQVLELISTATVKSREQTYAANISKRFFTRLNNIPYPYVFSCDSSSASYGLSGTFGPVTNQVSTYPYIAVFNELSTLMKLDKFDRFTLDSRFMIRDLGDLNGDGQNTDLRSYVDSNGDNQDDYDSGLCYFDQNADGDFRDIYGTPEITEEPHTRLKEVTLKLFKGGELIFQEAQLVSWEKFTGVEGKAAGATLSLLISTPSENSSIYSMATAARQNSFNLPILKTYPQDVIVQRADNAFSLCIIGETLPNATLSWKLGYSTNPVLDTCTADMIGGFNCSAANVTNNLTEGANKLFGQATKDVYYSPWSHVTFIRDISTPTIRSQIPTGTIVNRQPTVQAVIVDEPLTPGRIVSGINSSVMTLFLGTSPVNHRFDSITGCVSWMDASTNLPPVLPAGSYTMVLEGGDNACYKARSTWTFTVDIPTTDNSAPSVSHKDPSGATAVNPPVISCRVFDNQSGIDVNSIVMSLDGTVIVSSGAGNLTSSYTFLEQQDGGTVSYTPSSALSSGAHTVTIRASHWATDPANKITSEESWSFNVP